MKHKWEIFLFRCIDIYGRENRNLSMSEMKNRTWSQFSLRRVVDFVDVENHSGIFVFHAQLLSSVSLLINHILLFIKSKSYLRILFQHGIKIALKFQGQSTVSKEEVYSMSTAWGKSNVQGLVLAGSENISKVFK